MEEPNSSTRIWDGVLLRPDKQGNLTPVSHSAASTDMATAKAGRAT